MQSAGAFRGAGLLVFLTLLQVPVAAPGAGITVQGWVVDTMDHGIADARVTLRPILTRHAAGLREARGEAPPEPVVTAASDAEGYFVLTASSPGLWEVRVEAPGLVPMRRPSQ